jgi:hypothetical protein
LRSRNSTPAVSLIASLRMVSMVAEKVIR